MALRAERIGRELHRHMARALADLLRSGLRLTITRVRVTDNIRTVRVWLHGWDATEASRQVEVRKCLEATTRAASQTKFTPRLVILNDDSADYAERIEQLLN